MYKYLRKSVNIYISNVQNSNNKNENIIVSITQLHKKNEKILP